MSGGADLARQAQIARRLLRRPADFVKLVRIGPARQGVIGARQFRADREILRRRHIPHPMEHPQLRSERPRVVASGNAGGIVVLHIDAEARGRKGDARPASQRAIDKIAVLVLGDGFVPSADRLQEFMPPDDGAGRRKEFGEPRAQQRFRLCLAIAQTRIAKLTRAVGIREREGRQHDVGLCLFGRAAGGLQQRALDIIVGVEKQHVGRFDLREARIAAGRRAAAGGHSQHFHRKIRDGAFGRYVKAVEDDDRPRIARHAFDRATKRTLCAKRGHDDRDPSFPHRPTPPANGGQSWAAVVCMT